MKNGRKDTSRQLLHELKQKREFLQADGSWKGKMLTDSDYFRGKTKRTFSRTGQFKL